MKKNNNKELWKYREAKDSKPYQKYILFMLIIQGLISIFYLANWWFREVHISSVPLYLILSLILWWSMVRMAIMWISYTGIQKPEFYPAVKGKTVAIFTTSSPGEPLTMFEKTLEACARITYPHTTYLLDDTSDIQYKNIAEKYGAVWLEIKGFPGAKAGKINEALKRTKEEYILILDPDHIPFPNFLDEVLGFFEDPQVGFVQVSQAYYNQYRSFTAKAAAEQTYTFYGPSQMGMHGYNCAVAIGANCTFRRSALESIGGHGIGLAEDLVTSIRIHAKGWKSVYNPVIVSRGLVPEDLHSFSKQQLKWSRGLFEVLFAEIPKHWRNLSYWQKLSYLTISTYYNNGLNTFLFFIIPYLFIWFNWLPGNMNFADFVIHWSPVALTGIVIYLYVQNWLCHPQSEKSIHWRGMILKYMMCPVFLYGFVLALVDKKIPYIPTAKKAVKGISPFVIPLFIQQIIFIITIIYIVIKRRYFTAEAEMELSSGIIWGMLFFASISFIISLGAEYITFESARIKPEEPWLKIDIKKLSDFNHK